jgi:hypothetical protein
MSNIPFERMSVSMTGDADFDEALNKCAEVLTNKGRDYAVGSTDRLHNFKTAAEFLGLRPIQTWSVYAYKHMAAIFAYVKNGGQHESEPIEGRIVDLINYLLLLYKMVKETAAVVKVEDPDAARAAFKETVDQQLTELLNGSKIMSIVQDRLDGWNNVLTSKTKLSSTQRTVSKAARDEVAAIVAQVKEKLSL